ncbi:hypothetical protein PHMEG_00027537 [Phytophthora megakarya]|uniref:DDE-1 domain-containing protein n=1 Tax=Phytophthora megakarya TaxID=4795 RepID=A0A225V845_9STRA|nr:hypothetical protein PHMEG_00027537 [Phytophthora megakarya]
MDQTAVYIDMNGRTTVDYVGSPTVDVVQASATGKKLPPFVVFTGVPGGPVSQEVFKPEFGASTVEHTVQVWKPSVDGCRLLLLDSLKTHKMESVRNTLQQECGSPGDQPPLHFLTMSRIGCKSILDAVVFTNAYYQTFQVLTRRHGTTTSTKDVKIRRQPVLRDAAHCLDVVFDPDFPAALNSVRVRPADGVNEVLVMIYPFMGISSLVKNGYFQACASR